MDSRSLLLWHAMKAKKKSLIDAKTLDTIRVLCKLPSPSGDSKVIAFLDTFLSQLEK